MKILIQTAVSQGRKFAVASPYLEILVPKNTAIDCIDEFDKLVDQEFPLVGLKSRKATNTFLVVDSLMDFEDMYNAVEIANAEHDLDFTKLDREFLKTFLLLINHLSLNSVYRFENGKAIPIE